MTQKKVCIWACFKLSLSGFITSLQFRDDCFAEIRCPPAPLFDWTSVDDESLLSALSVAVNTTLNYTCDDGFRFIDGSTHTTLRCDVTGQWSGLDGLADVNRCATVRDVAHVRPIDDAINATNTNTERMVCEAGFQFEDGSQFVDITCVNNTGVLQWQGFIPDCERMSQLN